jgi:anti-anti-sigma factor
MGLSTDASALDVAFHRIDGDAMEISATGSLVERTVTGFRNAVFGGSDASPDRVLVDLSCLRDIDDAGLAVLLLARIELEARGGALAIFSNGSGVGRALERARLGRFVDIAKTRTDALRLLRSG